MEKPSNKVLAGIMILLVGIPTLLLLFYLQGCELLPLGLTAEDIGLKRGVNFAVFGGGAGMTNQGIKTEITGDMGTTGASTMITGFHDAGFVYTETPSNVGTVNGAIYTNAPHGTPETFAIAKETAANLLEAFNFLAGLPDGIDVGNQLGGLTLAPGIYKSPSGAFLLTGSDLTLDAKGDPDAVWVFQMGSSLTVGAPAAPRNVILINGAMAKNVFWQVGSAATINGAGGGTMVGTIISSAAITFSTAGNQKVTRLHGRALAMFASVTMVNTVIVLPTIPLPPAGGEGDVVSLPGVTISGTKKADVVAVAGNGTIEVENNGGLVTVTEIGTGTIRILNNGGVLTATNTGNGVMTIDSTCTGAVTVTNTGNGNTIVHARGEDAVTYTHSSDEDVEVTLPAISLPLSSATLSKVTITGKNAADVVAVAGDGFINVINNGAHVAATETGTGTINIVNNGGVLTATNTGNGTMTIDSTATGAVTVTNTGSGNTTVHASGAGAVAYTHSTNENVEVTLPAVP